MDYDPELFAKRDRAILRASRIFAHDIGALIKFLATPHPDLEGATPDTILDIPGGDENVMALLDKIDSERNGK